MATLGHQLAHYKTAETSIGLDMLSTFRPGDLLVADTRFAGSSLYFKYQERGLEFVTPVHQALKVERLKKLTVFSEQDFIAEVLIQKLQRKRYPYLPEKMTFRFVRVKMKSRKGNPISYLVTSLLDEKYSAQDIREFYKLRWPIETLFEELKLPLSADILRSKTVNGIFKEMAAKVMAYNLLRCLMLEAALRNKIAPSRISFIQCMRLAIAYSLRMSSAPAWQLPTLYDEMIFYMCHYRNPFRPGRMEPRAIKRDKSQYPWLKISRLEWRRKYVSSA